MRITAAIQGSLAEYMAAEVQAAEKAVTVGVKQATDGLKLSMRRQVASAGLGQRLANTWRGKVYPQGQVSLKAAGLVYTNAPEIMTGLETATVIRGKDGLWLAIPTPNAPKRGMGGKRITPSNFPEQSLGRLRFVYRPSGVSLLVVDNVRASFAKKTGVLRGFKQASDKQKASGRGLSTAVMFWLVLQVRTKKRIDLKREAEVWQNRLPVLIVSNWKDPK
jgi:hypothetical protein